MSHEAGSRIAGATAEQNTGESVVSRLAQFFPGAMALHLPVTVTVADHKLQNINRTKSIGSSGHRAIEPLKNRAVPQNGDRARDFCEQTVIEFGTTREVLFRSSLLLGFGDRVHLKNSDGSFDAEGDVVAMQYHDGRMAVAVRFARDVANWIIKV